MDRSRNPHQKPGTAWKAFILKGKVPKGRVRPEILASWKRCRTAGVNPKDGACHLMLSPNQLKTARHTHKTLIDTATPFINKLYEFVAGTGLIVFLSDENGSILESIGDYDVADNASKVNLVKGTVWTEEAVGTNGIGTALKVKAPVQVAGKEHFCAKLHTWTCSAAPIRDPSGLVIGALQLSGPSNAVHLHTLGMIVASVEAVESQLRIREKNRELVLVNNRLNNIFQTMSDGAVITDRTGKICQINPVGQQMLGTASKGRFIRSILGDRPAIWEVLGRGEQVSDLELMVDTDQNRIHCLVTARPIWDGKHHPDGAVIFFNPINKIKRLINRFSSAHASFQFSDIIGTSPGIRKAIEIGRQAASGGSNILISGESGTGKELFAQAIHNKSPRCSGPFIALNCAALPRELIASELFGYADGAFTGAKKGGRPGKFEMAAGGTLFLDEIGDMPLDQQAILLRVLQEREIMRIGGDHAIPVDVRVICATHKDLKKEVEKGNFRTDLYYRLNVILLQVPALRHRAGDIGPLFDHLLYKICARQSIPVPKVCADLLDSLQGYDWPGNVRELENVVEKLVSTSRGEPLTPAHLPGEIPEARPFPSQPVPARASGEKNMSGLVSERNTIISLLSHCHGNISQVARQMHMSRNTIYRKLKFYGISRDRSFS